MSVGSLPLINVASVNTLGTSDTLVVISNGGVRQVLSNAAFSNINLEVATLLIANNATPANSSANVTHGTVWFDSNYLYVATANNVLKRVSLSSF